MMNSPPTPESLNSLIVLLFSFSLSLSTYPRTLYYLLFLFLTFSSSSLKLINISRTSREPPTSSPTFLLKQFYLPPKCIELSLYCLFPFSLCFLTSKLNPPPNRKQREILHGTLNLQRQHLASFVDPSLPFSFCLTHLPFSFCLTHLPPPLILS